MKSEWLNYLYLPIATSLIIFYLCCLIQSSDVPEVEVSLPFNIQMDKAVHFCMYFGLSITAAFNYLRINKGNVNLIYLLIATFIIPVLYGGLIEIIQHNYCENRSGDWYDFLADFIGSLLALPFIFYYRYYLLTKNKRTK